jgi:uncharacterized protein (DUF983 family)
MNSPIQSLRLRAAQQPVSLAEALWRGLRMKCPHCGKGKVFGRYLKVADHCTVCCEELCHHRADDLPPYLVITLVGHAIVPTALLVEINYAPPIWLQLAIWLPLTLVSALALLQPIKGAVVGLQWQLGLGGFGESKLRRATTETQGAT